MFTETLVLLGMMTLSTAEMTFMAPCTVTVQTDGAHTLDKKFQENDGIWSLKLIPKDEMSENVDWMFTSATATKTKGVWIATTYYQDKDGEPKIFLSEEVHDSGNGHSTAYSVMVEDNKTVKYEFKIFTLKYVPGSYYYAYVCSNQGLDTSRDYRYVFAHADLTDEMKDEIKAIEKQYNFTGELKGI